jgi:Fur family ferric uptake transcriptional regulator
VSDSVNPSKALALFHKQISTSGLKSTRQRDLIVETFFRLNQHISTEELLEAVRRENRQVGYATVYRTLKILVEHDMANPRDFGDGITRYDPLLGKSDLHDHLICIDCRRVLEFGDKRLHDLQNEIAFSLGDFEIMRRRLEIYVKCTNKKCSHRP